MADPNATTWTPEELAALPQTEKVFDAPKLHINQHEWLQRGYMIEDNCKTPKADCVTAGIPIPTGSLLIKTEKGYDLVNEVTRQRI